jgi:hypothetical protein
VIETVKTILLNWTLNLEKAHILGEGMTFTSAERKQASSSVYNNVNNFYGSVDNSMFQTGSPNSSQVGATYNVDVKITKAFLGKLSKSISSLKLDSGSEAEIRAEISTIESQLKSPRPKSSIVDEGLKSIRNILEGASGGVAAQVLLLELAKHFPHLLGG